MIPLHSFNYRDRWWQEKGFTGVGVIDAEKGHHRKCSIDCDRDSAMTLNLRSRIVDYRGLREADE